MVVYDYECQVYYIVQKTKPFRVNWNLNLKESRVFKLLIVHVHVI